MQTESVSRPWTYWLFVVQCTILLLIPILIVAYRLGALDLKAGFLGSAGLIMLMAALGVLGLLVWLFAMVFKKPNLKSGSVWTGVLGLLPLAISLSIVGAGAFGVPPIHDISTDTKNPPLFLSALLDRAETDNSVEYDFDALPEQQRKAYPDVSPLILSISPKAAFAKARQQIIDNGWVLTEEIEKDGHLEATYQSAVFGFKDDVVVRIRPAASGSMIDMRSSSRVGLSDLGANAKRIRAFLADLQ